MRRDLSSAFVVPSVVHWKQNHYAAIVDYRSGLYLVKDPTFGAQRWMLASTIAEESSGVFLVPAEQAPGKWKELSKAETDVIRGRGLPNNIRDEEDEGCTGDCPDCTGAPIWMVTEPFINQWLYDQPVAYQTSTGRELGFMLSFKQREFRIYPAYNNSFTPKDPRWNHAWLSYVKFVDPTAIAPRIGCTAPNNSGLPIYGIISTNYLHLIDTQVANSPSIGYTEDGLSTIRTNIGSAKVFRAPTSNIPADGYHGLWFHPSKLSSLSQEMARSALSLASSMA